MFFSYDPSRAGGVQEHIIFLSKFLKKSGHHIDIYGPKNSIYPFENYYSIANPVQIPMIQGNFVNITISNGDKNKIIKEINQKKYDIFHFHDPHIPFFGFDLVREIKAKKIATFHLGWDDDSIVNIVSPLISLYKDEFSKYFSGAIFVSNLVRKRWINICSNIVINKVIYNGIDNSLYKFKPKKIKQKNILFVGRLVPRKGPKYLLRSFKKLITGLPDARLTILGRGDMEKSLFKYVKSQKLTDKVHFLGEIIGKNKIEYYQEATVFVAPYTDEAFGITILEAMACGIPIVGFRNQAFLEILKDYPGMKYLVKNKNSDQLTSALINILKNKNIREKISTWSLKKVKEFSWSKVARETERMYYEVLGINPKY